MSLDTGDRNLLRLLLLKQALLELLRVLCRLRVRRELIRSGAVLLRDTDSRLRCRGLIGSLHLLLSLHGILLWDSLGGLGILWKR